MNAIIFRNDIGHYIIATQLVSDISRREHKKTFPNYNENFEKPNGEMRLQTNKKKVGAVHATIILEYNIHKSKRKTFTRAVSII